MEKGNARENHTPYKRNSFYLYYEEHFNNIHDTTISYYDKYIIFSDGFSGYDNEITYYYDKVSLINKLLDKNKFKTKNIEELTEKERNFYISIVNDDAKILFLYCLLIEYFDAKKFMEYLENNNISPDNYYFHYEE